MSCHSSTGTASIDHAELPADPPLFEDARHELGNADSNGNGTASSHSNGTTAASGSHAAPKKPFEPSWPLTSWANTPQNAVCIAFLMGAVFALALSNASSLSFSSFSPSSSSISEAVQHLSARERFVAALRSPRLGVYVAALVVFHLMEYLTTAIWNPSKVEVRSFLLEDKNHNAAHAFALAEYLLEETFFPSAWLAYKHNLSLVVLGLLVTAAAQYLRSLAMATAATNFSHLIVYEKAPEHSLVRTGIYGWSRHPSYVAFFYWALGTQIFIGNPVAFLAFSVILYRFFSHRIKVEEWYLVRFFGKDYEIYQKEVPARIPFIR